MAQKTHQCILCKKLFSRPSKLQYHIAYHHEKKFSFECTLCGKPYSNQDHVNRHFRTVHQKENLPTKKFHCTIDGCLKIFSNKQNLDRHKRLVHLKVKSIFSCFYCSKSIDDVETHLIHEHQSISKDKLKCLDCLKEFNSVNSLIHHRIVHTDERRLVDVQWTMNRLLDEIERNETYQCHECNRIFRSLYQFDQHRHSQIHQKQFQCSHPNCHKTFVYMRNLRQHQKNHHETISRLPCPIRSCSKTYTTQSSIDRHLKSSHSNSTCKSTSIRRSSFLPGFKRQTRSQMKTLMDKLLIDSNPIVLSDEHFSTDPSEKTFDSNLLKGYEELGLVKLF